MLTRGLLVIFLYTSINKYLSTFMIEAKSFLKPLDSHCIMYVSSNKGAEFDEISKTFHHPIWYIPFKCGQIHLLHQISKSANTF